MPQSPRGRARSTIVAGLDAHVRFSTAAPAPPAGALRAAFNGVHADPRLHARARKLAGKRLFHGTQMGAWMHDQVRALVERWRERFPVAPALSVADARVAVEIGKLIDQASAPAPAKR